MKNINDTYAQELHSLKFNPYSQYCVFSKESQMLSWTISALTDLAAEEIIESLYKLSSITITKHNVELAIEEKTITTVSLQSITNLIDTDSQYKSTVEFITPTSFKSDSRYIIMPSIRLMFQNLLMRYGYVYGKNKEVDEETLLYLEKHLFISAYSLRSHYFSNISRDGKKLPAFLGSVSIRATGPQHQIGLTRMLLKFGEYAGIGIKSSMGMGAMHLK